MTDAVHRRLMPLFSEAAGRMRIPLEPEHRTFITAPSNYSFSLGSNEIGSLSYFTQKALVEQVMKAWRLF